MIAIKNIIKAATLILFIQCAWGEPITLRLGDEVDKVTTKSGVAYENFTVKKITKSGVRIMLNETASWKTMPAEDLPQYKFLFDRIKEPATKATPAETASNDEAPRATYKPAWEPKSLDDVTEACLFVWVTKKVEANGKAISTEQTGGNWVSSGSAFLCNIGKTTYIYSNVHNFFGTKEFYFEFKDGRKIDPREYAGVEVATGKAGYYKKIGRGGDVIRIRLRRYYPKALTLDRSRVLNNGLDVGRDIAITGNTKGRGEITKLEGKIKSILDYDIIDHNAASQAGNSGSPIVDLNTFKVLGILTWGSYDDEEPLHAIWLKKPVETRESRGAGASLARIKFKPSSFKSLYEERLVLNRMKNEIRLLGLLDTLVPRHEELLVNTRQRVMGDYTVDDLLNSNPNHIVVKRLRVLDKKLSFRKDSNIKRANQDTFSLYRNTYSSCLRDIQHTRSQIERSATYKSAFFKYTLQKTELIAICEAYEKGVYRTLSWFKRQMGTKGDAIPLGSRPRLPDIKSGLAGLGIHAE